jgi:hypothetical protein
LTHVRAVADSHPNRKLAIGAFFFLVALVFVWRSFYAMRIPVEAATQTGA